MSSEVTQQPKRRLLWQICVMMVGIARPTRSDGAYTASLWRIYVVVVGVGICCGSLILAVHELTGRRIAENRAAFRGAAALQVLPGADRLATIAVDESGRLRPVADPQDAGVMLAGYGADGALVGLAIEAAGRGYQDTIRLIYGYSPDRGVLLGFRILESRETPGLGDRVETDAYFGNQFQGLAVPLADDRRSLRQPITFSTAAERPYQTRIDGISGATVSSRAVTEIIAASAERWVPLIAANRDRLAQEAP